MLADALAELIDAKPFSPPVSPQEPTSFEIRILSAQYADIDETQNTNGHHHQH